MSSASPLSITCRGQWELSLCF